MKHIFTLCLLAFLGTTTINAQNYIVSGSGNSNENGTYVNTGNCNGYPYYILGNYVLSYDGYSSWGIGNYSYAGSPCGGGWIPYDYNNYSNSSTPPTSGWDNGLIVSIAAPKVTYSSSQFIESSANNGTISNSITITHNNYSGTTFLGNNGENFVTSGKVIVSNLPSGLTASVIRNNSLSLTILLSGNAIAHTNANDINNLSVVFKNSAFSNNNAAITVNGNSNLRINFIEVLNVGTGKTYTTIQSAVNAAGDFDVISLAAQTFTESGIDLSNKSISIIGQSPSQTIIQANASPGAANNRVFKAIYSTYSASTTQYFEKLTIRNGNYTTNGYPDGGGAVKATNTNLSFKDCYFESNKATTVGGYFGNGGGAIQVQWCKLNIENCTFYDNKFDAYNYGDFMGGGAIAFIESYGLNIKNSTFASNNAGGKGGGAIFAQVSTYPVITAGISIVNSTFTGNSTAYNGGAYYGSNGNASTVTFKNNIFYGNTDGGNGPDLYSENGVSYAISNCLIGNSSNIGSLQGNFTNCITGQNPQLGSLADNGGYTKTFAIPSNSPANNAGLFGSDIPTADQRGVVTYGGTKDIGSFEYDPCPFPITPSVSISTSGAGVCDNASATFTSTSSTSGSSPIFQWKKNGVDAGSGSTITFLSNSLSNGDVITCVLTANNVCQTTTTANSNTIVVTVKASPSVAQITNGISTITTASLCTLGSTYNYYNATPYGTWSSSNPAVASVTGGSQAGVITANINGTATISYNVAATNGCVSTSSILVTAAQQTAPTAITGTNSICVGATSALSNTAPVGTTGVWSSSNDRGIISVGGVYTANNAGNWGEARYTVTNAAGCKAYAAYAIIVNPIPAVPTITYAAGTVGNPQAGAPTGSFCVGKKFRVAATPNIPAGVWSATGAASIAGYDTVKINAVGAGSIKYTYTSAVGCSNSRTMSGNGFTCVARGVSVSGEGLVVSGDFTMYPNPAKGFINLNVETLIGKGSVVVTDLYGKTVKTQALSMGTNTVDIAKLSKGMYFVSTITNEGKTTKKLVVE